MNIEDFIIIDEVLFRISHDGLNFTRDSFYVYVVIQTKEQEQLIEQYKNRVLNNKVRKIRCFYRTDCWKYVIKKLKYKRFSTMDNEKVACFLAENVKPIWSPFKDNYSEEEKEQFEKLDLMYNSLMTSSKSIKKYSL